MLGRVFHWLGLASLAALLRAAGRLRKRNAGIPSRHDRDGQEEDQTRARTANRRRAGGHVRHPDEPYVLPQTGLDLQMLKLVSGPVHRDATSGPRGLYREHCVHCHGTTGYGAGPTAAFLNPYPRDYRRGWYKFKSTKRDERPSTDDLMRTLYDGLQGSAMPSFKLLPEVDRRALVEYVKYLSIRGEMELAMAQYVLPRTTKRI